MKFIKDFTNFNFDGYKFLKEHIDSKTLKLKYFENIYVLGDILRTFHNRQYQNVYLQAHTVANNIKIERNGLNKNLMQSYMINKSLFMDYDMNQYLFLNNQKIELLKKNFLNNYFMEAFYREQDNKWMLKYLFKKRLGINLKNLK